MFLSMVSNREQKYLMIIIIQHLYTDRPCAYRFTISTKCNRVEAIKPVGVTGYFASLLTNYLLSSANYTLTHIVSPNRILIVWSLQVELILFSFYQIFRIIRYKTNDCELICSLLQNYIKPHTMINFLLFWW